MRRLRAIAATLAFGAGLLGVSMAEPQPAMGVGPLPACELLDILTVPRGYDDWAITLVDWNLRVGPAYKPQDLVSVYTAGVGGEGYVRKVAIADLEAMAKAARSNGTPLDSLSAYRGHTQQKKLFNMYVRGYGYEEAVTFSARPGHSEHQLGLTIDFGSVGQRGLNHTWEKTKTGAWMAENAWRYGWLMSYPDGKQNVVCYSYEPWHYRYVGRDLAKKIHDSGLTIREYLWANFTQVDPVPGLPLPRVPLPTATVAPSSPPVSPPSPIASPSLGPAGPAGAPLESPTATAAPTTDQTGFFGMSPATTVGLLVVLGSIGVLASLGLRRRSRRSHLSRR